MAGFLLLPGIELHTLATSRIALQRLVAKGKFRQDLAYALSTLTISLPPLKNRAEDIPLLAQHFLEKQNAASSRQFSGFAPAAMELLTAYGWPGNVEELEGAVLHAAQQATGFTVQAGDLPDAVHLGVHAAAYRPREEETIQLDAFLAEIEKELLERALRRAKGNKSKAAQLLGMNRQRLMRRLVQLGLAPPAIEDEPVVFEPLPEDR
jgi:DNA-binding NtrC family response regulator